MSRARWSSPQVERDKRAGCRVETTLEKDHQQVKRQGPSKAEHFFGDNWLPPPCQLFHLFFLFSSYLYLLTQVVFHRFFLSCCSRGQQHRHKLVLHYSSHYHIDGQEFLTIKHLHNSYSGASEKRKEEIKEGQEEEEEKVKKKKTCSTVLMTGASGTFYSFTLSFLFFLHHRFIFTIQIYIFIFPSFIYYCSKYTSVCVERTSQNERETIEKNQVKQTKKGPKLYATGKKFTC